ncbi:MAG TPA: hypothetical protein VHL80_02665 [Polyangia bacterium]|nr:hypothetical protein [Polyangia bacterium]
MTFQSMTRFGLVLGLSAGVAAGSANAQDGGRTGLGAAPLVKGPRTVEVVLSDIARALGSDAAWKAHKNVRMKLEMSFQGMGISGSGERFATSKDKALVVTDLPGMGTIREGSNGKVFWSQDPINGTRTLSGAEADQARIESVWNAELRMNELYRSIELAPSSPPGQECLVLTPPDAPPVTNCYDARSHLQVTQKGTRSTPQGDTPFSSTLKDWREVGGLKMAFSVDTQAGPITFTARMTDVKFDVPMDDKMFDPPGGAGDAAKGKAKPKKKK